MLLPLLYSFIKKEKNCNKTKKLRQFICRSFFIKINFYTLNHLCSKASVRVGWLQIQSGP